MAGQSDYLPPGLPFNRGAWPQEYRDLENLDLWASSLIKDLYARKVTRAVVEEAIKAVPENYREHLRARLNYWREQRENRGRS
ncbi:hypothetical protein KGP26_10500 [Serratia sp. JSRIV002]|uniref:hypothetical protein n=1 Tax=Serratia sp. JSRIV002 TaxID=2831894 RepID=UPI001CBD2ACE|nr:hypothetical protein [Serratia sp. JSRIV002]UAN53451.1 hypothetical protein KGP26_10500 [Serratia sp. JSRIV002]